MAPNKNGRGKTKGDKKKKEEKGFLKFYLRATNFYFYFYIFED